MLGRLFIGLPMKATARPRILRLDGCTLQLALQACLPRRRKSARVLYSVQGSEEFLAPIRGQ